MLHYALIFLVVGLIAGALGVSGVAAVASQIAWVLFVIAIVLFIVHLVSGRRRPRPAPACRCEYPAAIAPTMRSLFEARIRRFIAPTLLSPDRVERWRPPQPGPKSASLIRRHRISAAATSATAGAPASLSERPGQESPPGSSRSASTASTYGTSLSILHDSSAEVALETFTPPITNTFVDGIYSKLSPVYDALFGAVLQPGRIAAVTQMGDAAG